MMSLSETKLTCSAQIYYRTRPTYTRAVGTIPTPPGYIRISIKFVSVNGHAT